MDQQDIPFLTTAELAELIRAREVSPVEAASAYLDRIDCLNFKFNSYLTVSRKEAGYTSVHYIQIAGTGSNAGAYSVPVSTSAE